MKAAPLPFAQNHFLQVLVASYAIFWMALAFHPVDRADWFLENLLVFATLGVFGFSYRRFQLSNISYGLLALFLALHAIGAHYTYAAVPLGFWVRDWLHLGRNHFDRAIHFGFGLLLLYPMRELFLRRITARAHWALWLSVICLVAMSSFFEIVEAVIAQLVHPELGAAYLGTQGDIWDAQKDMAAALIGTVIAAVVLMLWQASPIADRGVSADRS
jgi:putative membrane protein